MKSEGTFDIEWLCVRVSMMLFWIPLMLLMISQCHDCPYPTGICRIYSFSFFFSMPGKVILFIFLGIASGFYLTDKGMVYATGALFVLSCIITSYHESNGIFYRSTAMSAIFGVQFIAYLIDQVSDNFDIKYSRIHYPVQIIAALYTLAAIAKLKASGLAWVNSGDLFPLQILKNYSFLYFDSGNEHYLIEGKAIAQTMIKNVFITKLILGFSLFIEATCFIAVIGTRMRVVYGIGLLLMHIGIYRIMSVGPSAIAFPMVFFFLNPFYYIYNFFQSIGVSLILRLKNTG